MPHLTDADEHKLNSLARQVAEIRPKLEEHELEADADNILSAISDLEEALNDANTSIEELDDEDDDEEDEEE